MRHLHHNGEKKVLFFSSFFDCKDIILDYFKAADSKHGLSFALSEVVLKLWGKYGVKKDICKAIFNGLKEPQVKKIYCSFVTLFFGFPEAIDLPVEAEQLGKPLVSVGITGPAGAQTCYP